MPLFDRVLIQKAEAVAKTKTGILIPEGSQAKVLTGKVIAVGEGQRTEVCFYWFLVIYNIEMYYTLKNVNNDVH